MLARPEQLRGHWRRAVGGPAGTDPDGLRSATPNSCSTRSTRASYRWSRTCARAATARAGSTSRIGVDLSGGSVTALAPALHRMGYRHFAMAAAGQAEALRLLLGRTAVPTPDANH